MLSFLDGVARSGSRRLWRIVENEECISVHRQDSIGASIRARKFYFIRSFVICHDHCADLSSAEYKRLSGFKMLGSRIFEQCHDIMNVDGSIHGSDYIAGRQTGEDFAMANNPGA